MAKKYVTYDNVPMSSVHQLIGKLWSNEANMCEYELIPPTNN